MRRNEKGNPSVDSFPWEALHQFKSILPHLRYRFVELLNLVANMIQTVVKIKMPPILLLISMQVTL